MLSRKNLAPVQYELPTNGKCSHVEAVFGNKTNIMRTMSFSMRGVLPIAEDYTIDGWSCFLVPSIGVDGVVLYNVFEKKGCRRFFPPKAWFYLIKEYQK